MTSTLVGIDEDLHLANIALAELQHQVIVAYEAQDIQEGKRLEEELALATQKRDSLNDTKEYIVNKERLQDCAGRLSTVLYLSQMADGFPVQDVANIVAHANAKNELSGVTGVLYVLRGWFASYLEGSADAIDRLVRRLKVDPRHQRFRIVQRTADVPNVVRRFPNNGLLLKRLETPQTVSQQNPEATMLCELSTHLKLECYVPVLSAVTRGRLAQTYHTQPPPEDPAVLAARPVALTRYLMFMQPLKAGPFYTANTMLKDPIGHAALLEAVFSKVRYIVEETNNSLCQGAILSCGHSSDSITCCFHTELPTEAVQRALALFRAIADAPETANYCPVIALHVAELEYSMDRGVRATGPALRLLRQHADLAMQHHKGVVLSEAVFVALQDSDQYMSFITTEFAPRRPVDVYIPAALSTFSWKLALEKREKDALLLKQQQQQHNQPSSSLAADSTDAPPPPARFRQSKKDVHQPTSEEANQKPIPGFTNEHDLRTLFNSLGVNAANDSIERSSLDAWLHTQESAGVPVYNVEVDRVLQQFADGPGLEFCTFDQFCMIVYQRLKG